MVIWLASYPRSGNTFFRIVLKELFNLHTYSIYNDPLEKKLGLAPIVGHINLAKNLGQLENDRNVSFVKTHEYPVDSNSSIYLIRDGRDATVSWANYIYNFERKGSLWLLKKALGTCTPAKIMKELIINDRPYGSWGEHLGSWGEHVAEWTGAHGGNTIIVRFEDFIKTPKETALKVVQNLRLDITPNMSATIPRFHELHQKSSNFFRKGETGLWESEMPDELKDLFWKKNDDVLIKHGYG